MSGITLTKRPRSEFWQYDFRANGRRYRGSTREHQKAQAEEVAGAIFLRVSQQTETRSRVFSPASCRTDEAFARHIIALEARSRDDATISNYERYANRFDVFFGERTLAGITETDVEAWRDWLLSLHRGDQGHTDRTLSPKYVTEHVCWLASVYNHYGLPNPTRRVERPRVTPEQHQRRLPVFSTGEMEALFRECGPEFRPAFTWLAYTGTRQCEMRDLRRSHQDIHEPTQTVWVTGKKRKRRQLSLSGAAQPAWDALHQEIARRTVHEGEPVFDPYNRWADKRLRALCSRVGIPERGPHALRHTFATHALLQWSWDTALVAKWLGHESISTTYRYYGHLIPTEPPAIWPHMAGVS